MNNSYSSTQNLWRALKALCFIVLMICIIFSWGQLNGRLFQGSNGAFGMDLSSLNIQRSRDHGVPGYNSYRELCQVGRRARTFDDFKDWIPPEVKILLFYA